MDEFRFDEEEHCGWYGEEKVKSVTAILKEEQFVDTTFFTEYGRDRGSKSHKAILYDTKGTLDDSSIDDAIRGRILAARAFRAETEFRVIEVEVRHFNRPLFYCGQPDLVCHLFGHKAIIDYKPWNIQWWTRFQLAAYELLFGDDFYRRYALRLGDDGRYRLTQFSDRGDLQVWQSIATVNRVKTIHNRRVRV